MITRPLDESQLAQTPTFSVFDAPVFPHHADSIPPGTIEIGQYVLRFAWSRADLHAVQSLRFAVFNTELSEGLESSSAIGRDEDERDPWFHHLMICHRATGEVVGTYRLQTAVMAATRFGFYSATLFELGAVPASILGEAVEIGRACVAPLHRTGRVLRLLWKGIARYMQWNSKRYLFGCCSVPGIDPTVAVAAWHTLHARNALHEQIHVRPRAHARALTDDGRARPAVHATQAVAPLPPLFDGYLSLGAKVCGPPAVDRDFRTTDMLVLLDVDDLDARTHQSLFG